MTTEHEDISLMLLSTAVSGMQIALRLQENFTAIGQLIVRATSENRKISIEELRDLARRDDVIKSQLQALLAARAPTIPPTESGLPL